MKKLTVLLLLLISFYSKGQTLTSEESYRNYFVANKDSIDPIEGIWSVSTTQEFYRYDTLYDVRKYPKAAKVAVMKKDDKYESYNLTGESYDVQFLPTDVIGVYLYKNYFPEIQQYSKAKAIISKGSEMEYTYDFPDDFLRIKFGDTYEEGTRVVNILKWSKSFPENKQ
ncbi:MAG TPA: hypothetical protein PLI47_03735 [Bacteroidia bacterium]|nr:hypothetical protein [Bacteroidota bacterium]MBK7430913.1 hypothetical protein [Bacteroidota bacterium]MBP9922644.1 hypothetical protein [Bacteroidia bacterium]HQW22385.1 hypothetical protein [Bacteroidia bacterium]